MLLFRFQRAQQTLLLGLLLACPVASHATEPVTPDRDQTRPNIILLMGDDHGWDETSYNQHPYLATPALDDMAAGGLRLDRFYSAHPSCSPTRGSVLTGRHPNRYGTFTPNFSIRPDEVTIADRLQAIGYRCGHFGKWHVGPVKADSPTNPGAMGFDTWVSHDNFFEIDPVLSRDGAPPETFPGESSQVLVDLAKPFLLETQQQQQPSFTVIWFGSPHEPYSGLPDDLQQYAKLRDAYPDTTTRLTSNRTGRPTTRPLGEVLQERYAEITAMDRAIGDLRSFLRDHEMHEQTLLWYCGDNGTPPDGIVTSPFRGQKGNHYEGGVRVPGIIEWPGTIRPQRSRQPVVTSDILPTLCDLTRAETGNRPLDGVSLTPLWSQRGEPWQRSKPIFFWTYDVRGDPQRAPTIPAEMQRGTTPLVKLMKGIATRNFNNFRHPQIVPGDRAGTYVALDDPWKLIVWHDRKTNRVQKTELYHLQQDPAEKHDRAAEEPERVERLLAAAAGWQQSVLNSLSGGDPPAK